MDNHLTFGERGEELAVSFLKEKGYKILERNWRYGQKEIDIIAQKNNQLIIVEVKTRSGTMWEQPFQAVNRRKQKMVVEAADAYVNKKNRDTEVRFDVISVVIEKKKTEIEHIENAFYPVWR
jgi:putative endonuclease